ncbi:DUF7091 family protein [Halobellus sp. GM3]|uniref:DUF7091 family protein n=1 Tax=Halobellus sp. GM3 TaxID=3458410 RepID=UPI00403DCE36
MNDRLERLFRRQFREAGRQYARVRDAYRAGRDGSDRAAGSGDEGAAENGGSHAVPDSIPRDGAGNVRIVCRRDAERRAAAVDDARPACFEAGHPDCEGCVEDLRDGIVETW